MLRILFVLLLSSAVIGCTKQEVPLYQSADALAFYRNDNEVDSLNYSFATTGLGKETDTLFIKMRVVGKVRDYARTVKLRTATGTTARAGVHFKLPEISLPAGQVDFLYPLVLYKTPEMKTEVLRIVLEAEPNEQFPGAVSEGLEPAGNTVSLKQMKVDVTDKITMPTYWDEIYFAFDAYSDVKYQFMIQVAGTGDFRPTWLDGPWTFDALYSLAVLFRNEQIKYEAIHGPLIDETGNPVTF